MKPPLPLLAFAILGCANSEETQRPIELVASPVGDIDYMATGTAPSWSAVIGSEKIMLTFDREGHGGPGSIRNFFYPLVSPRSVNGVRTWESATGTDTLLIEVRPGPCDRQDGFRFADEVRIRLSDRVLVGCGGQELLRQRQLIR